MPRLPNLPDCEEAIGRDAAGRFDNIEMLILSFRAKGGKKELAELLRRARSDAPAQAAVGALLEAAAAAA
jgi:hypothetical protein